MAEIAIFKLYMLVVARFGGMMASAPLLGARNFPTVAKIGVTALTALLLTPVLAPLKADLPEDAVSYALMAAGELLVGLAIGFVMTLLFAAVQLGGQIMDLQTGFGMMNVFNPAFESQFPIFGFFLFIVAVLYLLVTGGHRDMIRALAATYDHIPPGGFVVRRELMWEVSTWGKHMFVDGLMISAPVATAMVLAYATLGLLNRAIPQMHLFVIGFPITIASGLFVTALSLGVYADLLDGMFVHMFEDVGTLIRGLG